MADESRSRPPELRLPVPEIRDLLGGILSGRGFSPERAETCAGLFVEASLDGVYTHGLERFPRFVRWIDKGWVRPAALPLLTSAAASLERWNGELGPGNLNAIAMADRAVELARDYGLGCVALSNTNHWMRGGQYGLRIAEAGLAALCFTNTMPNLPAWGGRDAVLGNNPLVIALPRAGGPILLDMAMSQYSYGKIEAAALRGEELQVEGGWDEEGRLTRDPAAILRSRRPLQTGFWKGSGLSLVLDLLAVMLSGGDSVGGVGKREGEYGLSQVFVAFDLSKLASAAELEAAVIDMEERVHGSSPAEGSPGARFPGEGRLALRRANEAQGLPLRTELLEEIRTL
ncbi:MAG TPA: 3-dehydro-L-gulonate 2-dehydrogenase [Rectinemataceae bacterium]|nr:3-dehydro-L-gulonate 2-dehydrogenase [Rectinemataceae bacterium]